MKSFVATVILFSLLIGLIITNSIYTNKVSKELNEKISALRFEEELEDELDEIEKHWKKHEGILGISVGFKEIDKTNELIISLKVYYQFQNEQEFEKSKLLLLDMIKEITRLENFSFR